MTAFRRSWAGPGLAGLSSLAIVLAGCTALPTSVPRPGAAPTPAPLTVSAAPVAVGSISQVVSYSGNVNASQQVTVLPSAAGRVERVLVDVGSTVHEGDLIAQLQADTQNLNVAQAQANVSAAEARLATVQAGGRAEDVASAQEMVAQQQVRLANMQSAGPSR